MDKIVDEIDNYIIFIEDKGYYADKQNSEKWNFTEDYQYAKKYKTKKSAFHNLVKHIGYNDECKNKKVYIQPLKIKQIVEFELNRMEEIDSIKYEPKNIVNIIVPKLNVKVEYIDVEDAFWG